MSSLPSISHRLFVAAVGHETQAPPRKMRHRSDSDGEQREITRAVDAAISTPGELLAPAAAEMNVSALLSEP